MERDADDTDDLRFSGRLRPPTTDSNPKRPERDYGPPPPLYSIHQGTVKNVKDFGAFVQMPGFQRHGLVHVSQIAKFHVKNASDNVSVGDKVWVKVIAIGEGNKISLSMRVVDQQNGADLDPTNVEVARRRSGDDELEKPQEDAANAHVCRKCGMKGHFEHECYNSQAIKPVLLPGTQFTEGKEYGEYRDPEAPKAPGSPEAKAAPTPAAAPMAMALGPVEASKAQMELERMWEDAKKLRAEREAQRQQAKMAKLQRKAERARRREERHAEGHHHHHHHHRSHGKESGEGASAPAPEMTLAQARALLAAAVAGAGQKKHHHHKHKRRSPSSSSSGSSSSGSESGSSSGSASEGEGKKDRKKSRKEKEKKEKKEKK